MKRASIQLAVQLGLVAMSMILIWAGKSHEGFTSLVGAALVMAFRERPE